jgi:hypothetical protein
MNYQVKIESVKSVEEIVGAWSDADYAELLKRFEYPDADTLKSSELKEYLFMAIADFEPNEAAAVILDYKLSDVLNKGQIDNLSHEMMREKVSENYSDIFIHKALFNINQLLYKAYNGKFLNTKATVIEFEIEHKDQDTAEITKEVALKALSPGLSDSNLILRLFQDQIDGKVPFPEADGIVWEFENTGADRYTITTSEKWIKDEEFEKTEFTASVTDHVEATEEVQKNG